MMKRLSLILGWTIAFGFAAAQAGERASSSGVFTAEQAKNGDRIYHERCSKCHGPDLVATDPDAPDLTAEGFKLGWIGKTVGNRFRTIRVAMPAEVGNAGIGGYSVLDRTQSSFGDSRIATQPSGMSPNSDSVGSRSSGAAAAGTASGWPARMARVRAAGSSWPARTASATACAEASL